MEVLPVLYVVHLGNELLLVAVRGVQTVIALRDQAFQVVVGLLYLVDVHFLEAYHLREPLKDYFLLIEAKLSQFHEEESLPHDLRLSENPVDELDTTCRALSEELIGEAISKVELDPRREFLEEVYHEVGWLTILT